MREIYTEGMKKPEGVSLGGKDKKIKCEEGNSKNNEDVNKEISEK